MELFYPDPELTDGVVRLRRWLLTDTECVRRATADPGIPQVTSVPAVFTPEAARAFIERVWSCLESGEGVALALTDAITDEALGQVWIGVRPQPKVVGLGYWVVPDARRRGFATRAARLAATWALGTLGAARIEAWVAPENEPSLRTLTSAGFHREGVLRSFLAFENERSDMAVWSRLPTDQ
jgi:ribosomal-protein-alanine N-acetyltransferase